MIDIYIARHANTFDPGDTVTRVGGRTDLALSGSGMRQAGALAAHLRDLIPRGFDAAYCSPLLRTRQTAEIILSASARKLRIEALEFLREIDYGPDENQPEAEVIARIGQPALDAWEQHGAPPPGWLVEPHLLRQSWTDLFTNLTEAQPAGSSVLIVTSNGIARFALAASLADGLHRPDLKLRTAAYGHATLAANGVLGVKAWNVRPT